MTIKIQRFKNIESIECPTDGIVLLVGGNNSGKSSVLQAIQFGISVAQTAAMQGGLWKRTRLSTSIGQNDLVYSPIREVSSLAYNGTLKEDPRYAISITFQTEPGVECQVVVRKGRNKNILLNLIGQSLGEHLQSLEAPYCALVTGLAGIPSEEEFETDYVVRKAAARGNSNSVFRNILLQLKDRPEKWRKFQEQIGHIFPGYTIGVRFNPHSDEYIGCWVSKNGRVFPIDTCGTGVLQAVQIFSYINLFEPKILLLDEPDSHLHPNNQKALALELIAAARNGLRVIISSHSKHLVEALIDDASLVWLRNGHVEPNVESYEIKALMEIGALGVGERIGKISHVFLTEDDDRNLIEKLLEANGFDLDECEIVSYSGATNTGTAIVLINQLRKFYPDAKYVVHRDRDFMTLEELAAYQVKFSGMNVDFFIPDGNDLESCFLNAPHLSQVCGVSELQAQDILQAAYDKRRDELLSKYVNSRIEYLNRNGLRPNAGEISVSGNAMLVGPTSTAIHGKTLLKGVRDVLRERSLPDQITSVSTALVSSVLASFLPIQSQMTASTN
ncbi:MAG: ATP-binding protein [Negativicutes bacterium]|nr:ATP-binding protein [Negativicutes bacterium]